MSRPGPSLDPESMIGQAVKVIASRESWSPIELQRQLGKIAPTKDAALTLRQCLTANGYIERRVVVTAKAKARAGL